MPKNIPLHFRALLESVAGAIVLAQSVYFEDLVGDAQIIAATPEAARLYGYNHPSELEGKYTSQLDHPDDYQAIKMMSVARRLGLGPVPTEYDIRIILPDGSIRYIRKNVRQMDHEGDSYWMTTSVEITPQEALPLPDFRHILIGEDITSWFNMISVSELTQLVQKFAPVRNRQIFANNLTEYEFQHIIDEIHQDNQAAESTERYQILPTATADEVLDIGLGRTRRLPDRRFIHRCGNCAETWASHVRNPKKCPRSRDDSRGSKCGVSRWRVVTERGQACARRQERQ